MLVIMLVLIEENIKVNKNGYISMMIKFMKVNNQSMVKFMFLFLKRNDK